MWEPPLGKARNVDKEKSMRLNIMSINDYGGFSSLMNDSMDTKLEIGC